MCELFDAPFRGRIARETVEHSKRILQVVICFGGQWPHSTYMMPGGVTCPLDAAQAARLRRRRRVLPGLV